MGHTMPMLRTLADLALGLRCTLPTPEDACEGHGVVFIGPDDVQFVEVWDRTQDGSYRVIFDDDSVVIVRKNGQREVDVL